MKKILVYCWNSICEPMTIRAMEENGYQLLLFSEKINDYHADPVFAQKFITYLHEQKPAAVFSYDYFPLISMICQMNSIPYATWIYDCPQYTLMSKTISNTCNYIFCFDENYTVRLQQLGAGNIYHFPLAADMELYENAVWQLETGKNTRKKAAAENGTNALEQYKCDISFVGSLYNDDKNRLISADLCDYTAGYVEGLMNVQAGIYGWNLITEALAGPVAEVIVKKCGLVLGEAYMSDPVQMAADAVNMEVTSRDRLDALATLTECFNVTLYSGSKLPEKLMRNPRLIYKGTVDYRTQMPFVFHNSKINLNITSRTIETGVPQRVFDILACGGFCLTNYQKEIADIFEDGKELIMYTSLPDMLQKAEYYLSHEEERVEIARAGYAKVKALFGIKERIKLLLEKIGV